MSAESVTTPAKHASQAARAETSVSATGPTNILSFDLEDWSYLVMRRFASPPVPHPEQVTRQTMRVLETLSRHRVRATFFVLGRTAESVPGLIRTLADEGHELATHGYDHLPIHPGRLDEFAEDLRRAKQELASRIGRAVIGYRAPAFSVPGESWQAFFDVLAGEGIAYDSSVVPMVLPRYGIADFGLAPRRVATSNGADVVEFPLSLVHWLGRTWMVAGGGYWRLLPAFMLRRAIRRLRRQGRPLVTYFHNYEFDDRPLRASAMADRPPGLRRWEVRSNLFRTSVPRKVAGALREFVFAPFCDVLAEYRQDAYAVEGAAGRADEV